MFTKQHYVAIASIIKANTTRICIEDIAQGSNGLPCLHPDTIEDLADYFAANNPQFDRQKFLDTCGIEG